MDEGLRIFVLGLGSKVLLANLIGGLWNDVQAVGYDSISTPLAWMAAAAYSFQLYFDFYGYSLMAVGLGRIMGFDLPENFRQPYQSVSMTEFWRRWHITLGAWFREYVYIPLGGNRRGGLRTLRNLLVVWLLTGLWHGASWNFILWGLYFGVLLILEKYPLRALKNIPVLNHIYGLAVIVFGWAIFRCEDFGKLGEVLSGMIGINGVGSKANLYNSSVIHPTYIAAFVLGVLGCIPFIFRTIPAKMRSSSAGAVLLDLGYIAVLIVSILNLTEGTYNPFLYFRF